MAHFLGFILGMDKKVNQPMGLLLLQVEQIQVCPFFVSLTNTILISVIFMHCEFHQKLQKDHNAVKFWNEHF